MRRIRNQVKLVSIPKKEIKILRNLKYYWCYVRMFGHTFVLKVDGNEFSIFDPYINYLPYARRQAFINYHKKLSPATMRAFEICIIFLILFLCLFCIVILIYSKDEGCRNKLGPKGPV